MTTRRQNQTAVREGQQGGPKQKNQNAQGGLGAEQERRSRSGVEVHSDGSPGNPNPGNPPPGNANPGQTGTPGGKGKQDAPQNQKR